MEYLVRLVAPTNAVVLDLFMGSGTTGLACKKNGRRSSDYYGAWGNSRLAIFWIFGTDFRALTHFFFLHPVKNILCGIPETSVGKAGEETANHPGLYAAIPWI